VIVAKNFPVDAYKVDLPILAAFVLGLMTAISPCPLATNITATAYLSKNIIEKKRVLFNGVFYTLGRMFSYTTLGLIFYFGTSQFKVAITITNATKMIVFFVPITPRITNIFGNDSDGPAKSRAKAGPLPIPDASKP
jgi:cytochrome c biogenesis protein CcdA